MRIKTGDSFFYNLISVFLILIFFSSLNMFSQSIGISGDSIINRCETKSYTISIQNNSGTVLNNLVVIARLGNLTGFNYVSGSSSININSGAPFCSADPTVSGGYSGTCSPNPSSPYLTWNVDSQCGATVLNNGDTLSIIFELATDCSAVSGSLNTYVDYSINGTPMCDNSGVLNITVLPGAVTIKKTPNVIPQRVGQDVTWTLTVENTGFGYIKNVKITDVLGAGLAYVSSSPSGQNSGQTTTWDSSDIPALLNIDPGDTVTIDITATVIACANLDNNADVRFGCDPDPLNTCFDTSVNSGTATASVQRIVTSPLIDYSPPNVTFTYCSDKENVSFPISNIGDGDAYNLQIIADFGILSVSNVSSGAIYNNVNKRFEFTNPIPHGGTYNLSFDLDYTSWCSGNFPSGDIIWQNSYKDKCGNDFYPPIKLSTVNAPASSPSLLVEKDGGGAEIHIGDQITYNINSSYSGPVNCGTGSTGQITVVDTIPDGFSVNNAGGGTWVPGGTGTGGTITWTYSPPSSLNTSITLQSPDVSQCESYCNTVFTNNITASGTDCCGCDLNASDSEITAIECAEGVTSSKISSSPTERCANTDYTNVYVFSAGSVVNLQDLIFEEHAENQQEYVSGSLSVTLSGSGDITGSVAVTDNTPGGSLLLNFSGSGNILLAGRTLTIVYSLTATENTVAACTDLTFYSWSSLNMGTSGSNCLRDGIIHETTPVTIVSPAMSLAISGLGNIVNTCESRTITMTLSQTSVDSNPKDVKLVLSGLNYYVINPGATTCTGDVSPVASTPVVNGNGDYEWIFNDVFSGSGTTATITIDVQKRCTGSADLTATAYFDDHCNDDSTSDEICSVNATESPSLLLKADLLIEKTPEVYYADKSLVKWIIYITNRGSGKAYNVWVDDVLGSGLSYNNAVVDDMTGVTVTAGQDHNGNSPYNGASIRINEINAGERRAITFEADLISCNNLSNDVSTSWGCIGSDCQVVVSDNSIVEIPTPKLINTNTITPSGGVDACSSPKGFVTLRNTGQVTCYNLEITESLPSNLLYVNGSTRWRVNGGLWNGPNASYNPNPMLSPIKWTKNEISGLTSSEPGDTIEIEFDMIADCPFTGGDITVSTRYENPCSDVFNTSPSTFTAAFNDPDIIISKTRSNVPINCSELIEWTITVRNNSSYSLPIIWVEDMLDAAYTYASSVGDPPYTNDNGTNSGQRVTWELRNINPGNVVTLTLRANTDSSPCSPNLDNTVSAWWGCGVADGNSSTKPGTDPPDNNLCLTNTGVSTVRTETRQPDLGYLSIAMTPSNIDSCNDNTQLTVVIENTGPSDASDVDLVIILPQGLSYIPGSSESGIGADNTVLTSSIGDPSVSGNVITFYDVSNKANNVADTIEAANGNDTLVLKFSVNSSCYTTSDLNFNLRYYDCCGDNQYSTTSQQTLTALFPQLSVSKTPVNSQVDCAQTQTWTITVTNNGTGNAEVVRIEDTLGDWINYLNSGGPNGSATAIGGQVYGWEINNLASGASTTFTITGQLNPDGFPNQADCDLSLRENNVTVVWGCGTSGESTDGDPTTTGYDCQNGNGNNAPTAILQMPDLIVTDITPVITCSADGSFSGTISAVIQNQGNGDTLHNFFVSVSDGLGWTGTGTFSGTLNSGNSTTVIIDTSGWSPDCNSCSSYVLTAIVDPVANNDICECDESNNTYTENYSALIPDLAIGTLTPSCDGDGRTRVQVQVSNVGCVAINSDFEITALDSDGHSVTSNFTVLGGTLPLNPGSTQTVTFRRNNGNSHLPSDCSPCSVNITVTLDSGNDICECDGSNNSSTIPYTKPYRIQIQSHNLNVSCASDGSYVISGDITFANNGCSTANLSNFRPAIRIWDQSANPSCSPGNGYFEQWRDTVGAISIAPGGTLTHTIAPHTVTSSSCNSSCQLGVRILPWGTCDCGTGNNSPCYLIDVNIPDLIISDIDFSNLTCSSDNTVGGSVSVTVQNIGCGTANNITVSLNTDGCLNFSDRTIATLNSGSTTIISFNASGSWSDCTDGSCDFTAEVDPNNSICECDGNNNTYSETYNSNLPDLVVESIDYSNINCTNDNISGSVSVTIRNRGFGAATNFEVSLSTDGCLTFSDETVATLSAGSTATIVFNLSGSWADCLDCSCDFTAEVDSNNSVCECDGTNNTLSSTYIQTMPRLKVNSITPSCSTDGMTLVRIEIENDGCGDASGNFTLHLEDNQGNSRDITVSGLGAGDTSTVDFANWPTSCSPSGISLTATVDSNNDICECDNGEHVLNFNYSNSSPDLNITGVTPSAVCSSDGNISGTIQITVQNIGNGSVTGDFRISVNDGQGWSSELFFNADLGGTLPLPANSSESVTFNWTRSFTSTPYVCNFPSITSNVDSQNDICECADGNNTGSGSYSVPIPDLRINSVTPATNCTGDGNLNGSVTVNVENIGCGNANGITVRLTSNCGIVFTDQTVNLNTGTNSDLIFNYTPDPSACTCTFTASIDPDDNICESNGSNNTAVSNPHTMNIPDIEIQSENLSVSCLNDGMVSVSGNITLINNGCGSNLTSDIPMRITMYDNTGCSGNVIDQWTQTFSGVNIASGGGTQIFAVTQRSVVTNIVDNSSGCRISFRIEADYSDSICESDGTDNSYCADNKNISIPDIEISGDSLGISCLSDGQITVSGSVTMINNGCGANLNSDIHVRFTMFDNTGCTGNVINQWTETFSSVNITSGGGTQNFIINDQHITTNIVDDSTGCQVSIRVEADYTNMICESDGSDNSYCADNKNIDIPDIEISSDSISLNCTSDGNIAITGNVNIMNSGCGSNLTSDIPMRFTLYDNSGCTGTQIHQWTEVFSSVNINSSGGIQTFPITTQNITTDMVSNSTNCQISIRIESDYSGTICESNGLNNDSCSDKTVSIPDIVINSVTPNVSCSSDGNLRIEINASNQGCADINSDFNIRISDNAGHSRSVSFLSLGGSLPLRISETQTLTLSDWDFDCSSTSIDFDVSADVDSDICESSSTNNNITWTYSLIEPDLLLGSIITQCNSDATITFTIPVQNQGYGDASAVILNIYDDNSLIHTETFNLNVGMTNTIIYTTGTYQGDVDHHFRFILDEAGSICECNGNNNEEAETVNCPTTGIVTEKSVSPIEATGCSEVEFTLRGTNVGFLNVYNLMIRDILPSGFRYIRGSTVAIWSGGSYTSDPVQTGNTLEWNIGAILNGGVPSGDSISLTFKAETPACSTGRRFANTMFVFGDDGSGTPIPLGGSDPDDNDPDDSDTVFVNMICSEPQLTVYCPDEKTVAANEIFEIEIVLTNNGSAASEIRNAIITDVLPEGWIMDSFISSGVNPSTGPQAGSEGHLEWRYSGIKLKRGESIKLILRIKTDQRACGTELNDNISLKTIDECGEIYNHHNSDLCKIKVVCGKPVLQLQKKCGNGKLPGGIYEFEIEVRNSGDVAAKNVFIEDILPEGFTYLKGTSVLDGNLIQDPSGVNPIVWGIGVVGEGKTLRLAYQAIAASDIDPGRYCNEAKATGTGQSGENVLSNISKCCTVVMRDNGDCCINVEQYPSGFFHIPDLPLSFIDPYFKTEDAMFAVYGALSFVEQSGFKKDSMEEFVANRLKNYALSTVEEFYLKSRLGKTMDDGSLFLSFSETYPQRKSSGDWKIKRTKKEMTLSQQAFELLALLKTFKFEDDKAKFNRFRSIIKKKIEFINKSNEKRFCHKWKFEKNDFIVTDEDATEHDLASLYLAASELTNIGYNELANIKQRLKNELRLFNKKFNKKMVDEEFITILALISDKKYDMAKSKINHFEKLFKKGKIEMNSLSRLSLATFIDYVSGGKIYHKLFGKLKKKYFSNKLGLFTEPQSDFTFKLGIRDLATISFAFMTELNETKMSFVPVFYRMIEETGIFINSRNLLVKRPPLNLIKNYPFGINLQSMLSFIKGEKNLAPVFVDKAQLYSPGVKTMGHDLFPFEFGKIFSSSYETSIKKISDISFGLKKLGVYLEGAEERIVKEKGFSLKKAGKRYFNSLINSGAGLERNGVLYLPFSRIAWKGPKRGNFGFDTIERDYRFHLNSLASFMLAESAYANEEGDFGERIRQGLLLQKQILAKIQKSRFVPESFIITFDVNGKIRDFLPGEKRADKITVAKLFAVSNIKYFKDRLLEMGEEKILPSDLLFFKFHPDLLPFFNIEVDNILKKGKVGFTDILKKVFISELRNGKNLKENENLKKLWDEDISLPLTDRVENIKNGTISKYDPIQFILYLFAKDRNASDFRFNRTLNFFTYLVESEWGLNSGRDSLSFPSANFQIISQKQRNRPEPGDRISFRVKVENRCPVSFATGKNLGTVFLKAVFTPELIYAGTEEIDGLDNLNEYLWKFTNLYEGSILKYTYQSIVPAGLTSGFISSSITARGYSGFLNLFPENERGIYCEDKDEKGGWRIIPFDIRDGFVYEDRNANGRRDESENGVPGILFKDSEGRIYRSNSEGHFDIPVGDDILIVQINMSSIPYNYILNSNPSKRISRSLVLTPVFGLIPCVESEGFIYSDKNMNDIFDKGEELIGNILVQAGRKYYFSSFNGYYKLFNIPSVWEKELRISAKQPFYLGDISKLKIKKMSDN